MSRSDAPLPPQYLRFEPSTRGLARAPGLEHSLAFLREGFTFIGRRCQELDSDLVEVRLLGRKTLCMLGAEAASVFYDPARMEREGAMPSFVQKALLGEGGVQGLDGDRHRVRKEMFMSLMTPAQRERLATALAGYLGDAAQRWRDAGRVVLHDEMACILCRTVCDWIGIPLAEGETERRTRQLDVRVRGVATIGRKQIAARRARHATERWVEGWVRAVRSGEHPIDETLPLAHVAHHRGRDQALLPARVAAVELLNLIRTTVAIATYVTFSALTLHRQPEQREVLLAGDPLDYDQFVDEVRRFYPFFPCAAARVRESFEWRGYRFPVGRRVLLDLFGTDHDARTWHDPERFRPQRFTERPPDRFELVPQGGGDHDTGHRCAGEWITRDVMKTALRFLVHDLDYRVPEQDLSIDLGRIPTRPASGMVIEGVAPQGATVRPELAGPLGVSERPRGPHEPVGGP